MEIAVTGHRPQGLCSPPPWPGTPQYRGLVKFAETTLRNCTDLNRGNTDRIITGMALGWDQAIAQACVNLGMKFHAYVPFPGYESQWPNESQEYYKGLLTQAERIVVVTNAPYSPKLLQVRNVAMVDNASLLIALWNGSPSGTANCVKYARSQLLPVTNIWASWLTFIS